MERMSAQDFLQSLKDIDVESTVANIITKNPDEIIELVQEQLYNDGEDKYGNKLPPYKNKRYADKKHKMNPRPGYNNPDYGYTGAMYAGMGIGYADTDSFKVTSNVPYFKYLEKRGAKGRGDGSAQFDLAEDHMDAYREDILFPEFRKAIAAQTGIELK